MIVHDSLYSLSTDYCLLLINVQLILTYLIWLQLIDANQLTLIPSEIGKLTTSLGHLKFGMSCSLIGSNEWYLWIGSVRENQKILTLPLSEIFNAFSNNF